MKKIPVRKVHSGQQEPELSGTFSIRSVEEILAGKNMVQELHRHDFFYVLVLEKGTGTHEIDFVSYEVCDQAVFFMRPGHVHQLVLLSGSKGYLLQFKSDFYYPNDLSSAQLLRKASNKNLCQLNSDRFKRILQILSVVYNEYKEKLEGYEEVIKANLGIFFIELLRHRKNRDAGINKITLYTQERLEELLDLMETHISTHKQVSDYAGLMNLSVYQLNAITKEALGKTCSDLINEHIVLEAKRYLLATSGQVNQIAFHLGYEDVSYFIRFFKRHTGVTLDTFRKNFK